jgi:hypothetical protein
MSALRDEIRAILREEIAGLKHEVSGPATETVRISSSADLNRFAQDILVRASSPDFVTAVTNGAQTFALAGTSGSIAAQAPRIISNPAPTGGARLEKPLITEADIAQLGPETRSLRVGPHSRLTPLANDEARRKGIRIERIKA